MSLAMTTQNHKKTIQHRWTYQQLKWQDVAPTTTWPDHHIQQLQVILLIMIMGWEKLNKMTMQHSLTFDFKLGFK